MSSVGEARQRIGSAAEHSDKAGEAIGHASESLAEAQRLVTDAAGDIRHELVQDSLQKFKDAQDSLLDAGRLIRAAQEAAAAYADAIG